MLEALSSVTFGTLSLPPAVHLFLRLRVKDRNVHGVLGI